MKLSRFRSYFFTILISLVACTAKAFTPSEDGLYAVFDTSLGEFTAKLYFEKAPTTVANFVGLAENSISSFVDDGQGVLIDKPFYDGLTFHRVIQGFVIQGGSPNGLGNDGPGYSIPDEMDSSIFHTKAGILSMANSGLNTGGSQFFVTLAATPWLDGMHTVFGEVVDGLDRVTAIGAVAVDVNERPVNTVTINSVTIIREGALATAFRPANFQKPYVIGQVDKTLSNDGESLDRVTIQRGPFDDFYMYESSDMVNWSEPIRLLPEIGSPSTVSHLVAKPSVGGEQFFYRYSQLGFLDELSRPGTELNFTLPISHGVQKAVFGDGGSVTLEAFGNTDIPGNYLWWDLGDAIQIYLFYPFQQWYEVQIYIKKDSLASGTAFFRVNDPFIANGGFIHSGAFTLTP